MKTVRFTKVFKCSADGGKTVSKFKPGQEAELPDDIADSAVGSGAAKIVGNSTPNRRARKPVEGKGKKGSEEDK